MALKNNSQRLLNPQATIVLKAANGTELKIKTHFCIVLVNEIKNSVK